MSENDGTDVRCFRCGEGFKHLVMAIRDENGNYFHDWCPNPPAKKSAQYQKGFELMKLLLSFPRHELTIVLVILKVSGILPISWIWVTMPSWILSAITVLAFLFLVFIGGIAAIYEHTKKE